MDVILNCVSKHNGVTLKQLQHELNMKNKTISSRLTGLKYRKLIVNAYSKWYHAANVVELDDNQIELTLHNGNVEIWNV